MELQAAIFRHITHSRLVYSSCWEDPTLDEEALDLRRHDRLLVITSAGCNALHYLLCGAGNVHAVDCNPCQGHLLALKAAAVRTLDYESFFEMFGAGGGPRIRQMYGDSIRRALSPADTHYWDRNISLFAGGPARRSFYHRSTSGTAYWLVVEYLSRVKRLRPVIERLASSDDLDAQQELYDQSGIRRHLAGPFVRWLLSRSTLSSMMAIPDSQRREAARSYPGGWSRFLLDRIDLVFRSTVIRRNYFWYVALTGRYERDCCPSYLQPEGFLHLKSGLLERLHIHTATVANYLAASRLRFTRYVLLDHMDWMSGPRDRALDAEWSNIVATAEPDARVIFRSVAPHPSYLDRVRVQGRPLSECVRFDQARAARLHARDPVCLYGGLHVADIVGVPA